MKRRESNPGGNNTAVQRQQYVIVTFNLKGYADASMEGCHVSVQHPVRFVSQIFESFPVAAVPSVPSVRAVHTRLKLPSGPVNEYLNSPRRARLAWPGCDIRAFEKVI